MVRPPEDPGTFTFVSSSTSDDRTFLVGAQLWRPFANVFPPDDSGQPVSFYLLRFDPASRRTSLVPLPVPPETENTPSGMQSSFLQASLSPDGTQLAVADLLTDNRTLAVHVYPIPAAPRSVRLSRKYGGHQPPQTQRIRFNTGRAWLAVPWYPGKTPQLACIRCF